jgi:hypothetical protein
MIRKSPPLSWPSFTNIRVPSKIKRVKLHRVYYFVKPFIPRSVQIRLRRLQVLVKRLRYARVWPVDTSCGLTPEGWRGWPEGKKFALVLTHDVETAAGQEKVKPLAQLELELGIRSSFNFVPERYDVSSELRGWLAENGFEVGVHDLNHDGHLFSSAKQFVERAPKINLYLREWNTRGFRAGAMHHNLEWIGQLDIDYDQSTFDTDPFEPQPDGVGTIFPFRVPRKNGKPYVELPCTLPQDFTVFILLRETTIQLWKTKLDWIAWQGGMALMNVHPDYVHFPGSRAGKAEYPVEAYRQFLRYCMNTYPGEYWNALPSQIVHFCLHQNLSSRPGTDQSVSRKMGLDQPLNK